MTLFNFIALTKLFLIWINEWLIVAIVFCLMLLAFEIGFRMGINSLAVNDEKRRSVLNNFQVGLMSLLGLIIAFTFAMAADRFDYGRTLMAEETDALETAYFRADLLPDSTANKVRKILREYIDTRLLFYQPKLDETKGVEVNRKTKLLQKTLWNNIPDITKELPDYLAVEVIRSINKLIDASNKRYIAMENHVPELIFFLMFLISILTNLSVGYGCGVAKDRHVFFTVLFSFFVCSILVVIIDLDRPRRGLIVVSQNSLIELKKSIEEK